MAIQGFSHTMVLVTITACPAIIIKAGGGDPLADASLSTAEIIRMVVERKLAVNLISAKAVDQLGHVMLIVGQKKSHPRTSESSEDNVSSAAEKDNAPTGGVDSGGNSGDRRGQSSRTQLPESQAGNNIPLDVPTLLRRAADAFEEKVLPMFEERIRWCGDWSKRFSSGNGDRNSPQSVTGGTSGEGRDGLSADDPPPTVPPPMFNQPRRVDVVNSGIPQHVDNDVEETVPVHPYPVDADPPATHKCRWKRGGNMDHAHEVHDSNIIPDVSGVVNQILFDVGVREEVEIPVVNPSSGVREEAEIPVVNLSKSSNLESHSDGTGDGPFTNDPAKDVVIRQSKRRHTSPQRYSLSEPGLKKDAPKKKPQQVPTTGQPSKKAKKAGIEGPQPAPKMPSLPLFIGGFNAFAPPLSSNRDIFLKRVNAPKLVGAGDSDFSVSSLNDLFHCTGVCSHERSTTLFLPTA
ncbi:hypothetical protein Rs2_41130 [Raphanus sativus]|nr:hypothetical protein Rs2_41130 [Raphanus sativus]